VQLDVPSDALAARRRGRQDPLPALARAVSRRVGPEVSLWAAAVAPPGFDARHSARSRRYRYDVEPATRGDPLRSRVAWQLEGGLDLAPMRLGCDPLIGEHDFAAFCRRPAGRPAGPLPRRVLDARWTVLEGPALDAPLLRFEIEALAFCHQMVRSIVGLLVAIGQGRARPSDVSERLASGSRSGQPTVAPARGLCLLAVRYAEPVLPPRPVPALPDLPPEPAFPPGPLHSPGPVQSPAPHSAGPDVGPGAGQ
jgi:tRNA pseudouridine38-40 synthase